MEIHRTHLAEVHKLDFWNTSFISLVIFPCKSLTWIGLAISWIAHAKTIFALNDATKFLFSAFLKYSDTIIMPCKESSHIHSSLIEEEHQ